jgi:hypothetical protein
VSAARSMWHVADNRDLFFSCLACFALLTPIDYFLSLTNFSVSMSLFAQTGRATNTCST